jgi:hypothetical protein
LFGQIVLIYGNIPFFAYLISEDTMNLKMVTSIIVVAIVFSTGATLALTDNRPVSENKPGIVYDYYSGVGIFEKGVHLIATDYDPTLPTANPLNVYRVLKEHETTTVSHGDFASLIISRGDFPTGGYTILVKSFSWLGSYPTRLRFEVNFTNPGEGVPVTEAFTNPLVLIPLGKLGPGEYEVQVHVDTYILTYDVQGKPIYTQILTFKEELWTQTFIVE